MFVYQSLVKMPKIMFLLAGQKAGAARNLKFKSEENEIKLYTKISTCPKKLLFYSPLIIIYNKQDKHCPALDPLFKYTQFISQLH
jgi:hypothetical protein